MKILFLLLGGLLISIAMFLIPAMSFAAPQVTVAPAAVNVTVDSRLEKDSIQVSQSQSGGAKKILTDATGAITGIEPT
jgi:hypothetical protein